MTKHQKSLYFPFVWIVEMWNYYRCRWEPTVSAALSREDGRTELVVWKATSCDRFRLRKYYARAAEKKGKRK